MNQGEESMRKKKRTHPMSSLTDATSSEQQMEQTHLAFTQEPNAADPKPENPQSQQGLVPAGELPSAAETLAQLFPVDGVQPQEVAGALASQTALVSPASPLPQDQAHLSSTAAYDPYSLTPPAASIASETLTTEAIAAAPQPAVEMARARKTEANPGLPASPKLKAIREETSGEIASTPDQKTDATLNAQTLVIAAPQENHGNGESPKESRPGAFSRLAGGIRNMLASGRRKKGESLRAVASDPADMEQPPSVPAQISAPATPAADAMEACTADSAVAKGVQPPNSAALDSPPLRSVEGSDNALPATETLPAAPTFSTLPANSAGFEPDPPLLTQEVTPAAREKTDPDRVEHPAAESPAEDDTTFHRADFEGGFFDQALRQEPPQQTEPELSPTGEEEADFDSSDEDHAIASAIERYANITAAAQADSSADALEERTHHPTPPAIEPVDINAVLGIPRDPEPPEVGARSASFSSTLAGQQGFAEVESAVLSAGKRDLLGIENPLTNVPAHELPDGNSAAHRPSPPYRDWSFEEKLASHHEWIESKGAKGKKADFTGADLEGSDLIGVDLRFVDLHDANLRAADLLMADLRDACLARANIRDSCLVGANLEAANLEGASLETAMGLVPRQLAGANLHEASLPASVQQFEALGEFKQAARKVHGVFVALMSMSALSALLIWMTKDFQLIANSAVLPFLHSASAAAALPTVQFYLIAPVALFGLYLVFQFQLQHLWDLALELPAVFPDGRTLAENEPRIVVGLLRAHFRWMNVEAPSTRFVEKALSIFLAYWIVPIALGLYWVRFLTLQELRGTLLQEFLIVSATCVALYSTTKVGKRAQKWLVEENFPERMMSRIRDINPVTPAVVLLGVLTFLAVGTMLGVPHNRERAPQFGVSNIRRWAPAALWFFGIDPYPDLTEAVISKKPASWNGADDQVASVEGARLNGINFRYAQGYRAFIANAHLLHANLQGAFLSQADLRGADLGQSNLKYAVLDQAQMNHVNLDRATLDAANLSRADLRSANLSYASMAGATLVDGRLDGATLYGAKLLSATLIRTNFEKADLRESHLEGANLENADMQGAYLWSAKLTGAVLTNAQLGKAIFVNADLRNADLRWAHLSETVLTGANLAGAYLDGADLRGAVGFGANQICAAKSRHGLLLDDAMELLVNAQCGAGN